MHKRILILDDDKETLELLTRMLQKQYTILTETNAEELINAVANYQPHLLILDHFVGDENSRDIIQRFRKTDAFKNIPFIIHSAHEQIEQLANAVSANGFIRKPSSVSEIRSYISDILS